MKVELRKLCCLGLLARTVETKNAQTISLGKTLGNRSLKRPRGIQGNDIKMDLMEFGSEAGRSCPMVALGIRGRESSGPATSAI
jgi:hypothetical protein